MPEKDKATLPFRVFCKGADGSSNVQFYATIGDQDLADHYDWVTGRLDVPDGKVNAFLEIIRTSRGKTAAAVKAAIGKLLE